MFAWRQLKPETIVTAGRNLKGMLIHKKRATAAPSPSPSSDPTDSRTIDVPPAKAR